MTSTLCGCMEPEPRPDGTCDVCGLRRAGDDLTPEQSEALVDALVTIGADDEPEDLPRLRRVKGRKRPVRR